MKQSDLPSFASVADAAHYAEKHKPLKTALETFPNQMDYSRRYGPIANKAMVACWEACVRGDMEAAAKATRALSRALPASVFDYRKG